MKVFGEWHDREVIGLLHILATLSPWNSVKEINNLCVRLAQYYTSKVNIKHQAMKADT
jgi:hypothetical protein